jgi:hypothetical protein
VTLVVKNAIRKFRKTDTWFDVFDITTEGTDIDENVVENFEKIPNTNTINLKTDVPVEAGPDKPMLCKTANAFAVLMSGSHERKKPTILPLDKPRFTGIFFNKIW